MSDRIRLVFFGSPAFAVPALDAARAIAEVVGVVCQPDRPAGRGLGVAAPAVKVRALELGLPVSQPTKLRTGEFGAWMRSLSLDVALVVAYGRILPKDVLEAPRRGCVNVHASLLPKYRGAAPITWAVVNGETESGVTLMQLDEGLDTGPTFARLTIPIGPEETAGELGERLAQLGADAVSRWLLEYVRGAVSLEAQDHAHATLAPVLRKEDGRVDWTASARRVHDHVRGMSPWPGAFTSATGTGRGPEPKPITVKIHTAAVIADARASSSPGTVLVADKARVLVACGEDTVLELLNVQPEGRRVLRATEWAIGRGVSRGDILA
jgi:methionyl-tRNA formyltransferase